MDDPSAKIPAQSQMRHPGVEADIQGPKPQYYSDKYKPAGATDRSIMLTGIPTKFASIVAIGVRGYGRRLRGSSGLGQIDIDEVGSIALNLIKIKNWQIRTKLVAPKRKVPGSVEKLRKGLEFDVARSARARRKLCTHTFWKVEYDGFPMSFAKWRSELRQFD